MGLTIAADGVVTTSESLLVSRSTTTVLNTSGSQTGYTSADLSVAALTELALDLNFTGFTGGTSPTLAVVVKRKGADGNYYQIDAPAALTAAGSISRHMGIGAAQNVLFGNLIQVLVTVTGAPTAAPWTLSIIGK